MNKIRSISKLAATLVWLVLIQSAVSQTARPFARPDRIRYDSQCLTIEGKDVFIYSGAFHYFRCPKELWPDRFQKIKDAGFNCVETYVPWNYCEQLMPSGVNDFSKVDLKDLEDWLTMAEHYGFYVIARPGPYICAEWATGGFPQWLLTKKPANPLRSESWLRSDDPVFLAWSKHWYDAVCPVIAKHQITRKSPGAPGVILVQVENEYDFGPHFPDEVKINQVRALAQDARADGIDVPLITCWTRQVRGSTDPVLRQIFDCSNFYPRWNVEGQLQPRISELRAEQPDAPLATTELQGGWFSEVSGKLSQDQDGITAAEIQNITLFAMQMGDTIVNYYMLFGGSNPGDWAARNLTTTYDYNAPIREWGGVGDRYQRVWALGHLLEEHGAKLARAVAVDCNVTTSQNDVAVAERRAQDGSRYFFVRTGEHTEPREGTATVMEKAGPEIAFTYQLEPFGSKIFYMPAGATNVEQGQWLPKKATEIERPKGCSPVVTITSAKMQIDPGPAHWTKLSPGETLAQARDYGSDFVFYRAKLYNRTATNLMVEFPDGDAVLAVVNGTATTVSSGASRALLKLPKGSSDVRLLYENHGFANGGRNIEQQGGIDLAQLVNPAQGEGMPIGGWKWRFIDGTTKRPEIKTRFDDSNWTNVDANAMDANQLAPGQTAVFRARVEMSDADLKNSRWDLNFSRIDDAGWIYVNGASIGKTTDWSRAYSFEVTKHLHLGTNVIAVIVRNNDGGGGLGAPTIERELDGTPVKLQSFGYAGGIGKTWSQPNFSDKNWKTIFVGAASSQTNLLAWYRMSFQLPLQMPGIWVPWHLHLEANGNGFLYLNGHAIGRYWQSGPQHDFFLPECWLHFGDGKANVVALDLRPLGNGTAIHTAVIEPYADFAEKR
jgi:hypothetical protein